MGLPDGHVGVDFHVQVDLQVEAEILGCDLHWADDLSLDLISVLLDSLATTPLMLLCVYRPEQEHRVFTADAL